MAKKLIEPANKMSVAIESLGVRTPLPSKEVERATPFKSADAPQASYNHTEIYTYFTIPDGLSKLIYSSESWVKARFTLETAGPVAVSTRQDLGPLLSGKGRLLPPDVEYKFIVPKGDRIFIIAEAINRVAFTIEPIPWLQTIALEIRAVGRVIVSSLRGINRGAPAPRAPGTGKPADDDDLGCPAPRRRFLPKLTRGRR